MRRIFGLFCVLVFSVFLSLLFTNNNTYATNDLVLTFDSSTNYSDNATRTICDSGSFIWRPCSDWDYMVVHISGQTFQSSNMIEISGFGTFTYIYPYFFPDVVYSLNSTLSLLSINNLSNWITTGSVEITLTDTFPGEPCDCPEPEDPEPCPDPEENSRFIQVVLDAFWKYHQVFGGAVVAIIVIFFVYRLIKGVMR